MNKFDLIRNKINKNKPTYYAVGFFAFTIPYQNKYSNISIILLALFSLLFINSNNLKRTLNNKSWLFLVLNVAVFLTGLFLIKENSIIKHASSIGKYLLIMCIPFLMHKKVDPRGQKIILLSFCAGVIIGLLTCFVSMYLSLGVESTTYSNFTEPMGGIHPAYLSQFAVMSFFILLELFFKKKNLGYRLIVLLGLIFLIYSLLYLQARTPFLAFILCLISYVLFKTYTEKTSNYFKYISLILISGVFLFFVLIDSNSLVIIKERFIDNVSLASNLRLSSWKCAWEIFLDNPKALGVGFSNTQELLDECYKSNYVARPYFEHYNAHNQYLQTLVTTGIIGILIWLVTLIWAFYESIIKKNVLGLIFIVLFMTCSITEVYMARIWGVIYFSFFYSILVIKDYKLV